MNDQALGGALMWVMGGMLYLTAIGAIFAVYAAGETAKEPGRGKVLSDVPRRA